MNKTITIPEDATEQQRKDHIIACVKAQLDDMRSVSNAGCHYSHLWTYKIDDAHLYTIHISQEPQPLKDLSVLKGKWVVDIQDGSHNLITAYFPQENKVFLEACWYTSDELLRLYTYEDGSPICEPQEDKS